MTTTDSQQPSEETEWPLVKAITEKALTASRQGSWDDTGYAYTQLMINTSAFLSVIPWLPFVVYVEELLMSLADHGVVWNPYRVKWRARIEQITMTSDREAKLLTLECINLDHPNYLHEKP